MKIAESGRFLQLEFTGLANTIDDTGSGAIFMPLGFPHCCGTSVHAGWLGISSSPSSFQSVNFNTRARVCALSPATLKAENQKQ